MSSYIGYKSEFDIVALKATEHGYTLKLNRSFEYELIGQNQMQKFVKVFGTLQNVSDWLSD